MKTRIGKIKDELMEEIGKAITGQNELFKKQQEKMDSNMLAMTEEMDMAKIRAHGITSELRQHSSQIEGLDNRMRSSNLVIEGMAEKDDEETKSDLVQIIGKEINAFGDGHIKSIT